jgi:phospholipid/cholesterol/gamma-HCH transport system permease protein
LLRTVREFLRDVGFELELACQVVVRMPQMLRRRSLIADQLYQSGLKVVHVVLLVGVFIGMIVALQTGLELSRFGQQDQIGTIVALSMCREMGPFITATILAATVGSALAAEIGTMAVSEELSALEVMSIDRISYLVMPRVLGVAIVCPMLTVLCDAIGIVGGGLIAGSQLNVGMSLYYDSVIEALNDRGLPFELPKEVYTGMFKSFVFGLILSVISCAAGLKATSGAMGVGNATRKAVRDSIIAIIISNYFLSWLFFRT